MSKKILSGVCTVALVFTLACSKSGVPVSPEVVEGAGGEAAADGTTLKIAEPALVSPADGFVGELGSTAPITLVVNNNRGNYATFTVTYEFEVKNANGTVVQNLKVVQGTGSSGAVTLAVIPAANLVADTLHTWRVRATFGSAFGPWSVSQSFRTAIPAGCFGTTILDPLTNSTTCGKTVGGRFLQGQGWQALSGQNGLDYDIPTCNNCTFEFDITNIGQQEGQCCNADLKLLSMGDRNSFGSFGAFRDSEWKMHFIQRADNDGMEIIWRNGGTDPDGNPGDHRIKHNCCGPKFSSTNVNRFFVKWTPISYEITYSTNGGPIQGLDIQDGFGAHPYAPPNHRISLGCYPRGETIVGSVFRNIKLTPNK